MQPLSGSWDRCRLVSVCVWSSCSSHPIKAETFVISIMAEVWKRQYLCHKTTSLRYRFKTTIPADLWKTQSQCLNECPPAGGCVSLLKSLLAAVGGLPVVSLLHAGSHLLQQPRAQRFIHHQLQSHLLEHLAHWHLASAHTHRHIFRQRLNMCEVRCMKHYFILPPGTGVSWTWQCWPRCPGQFLLETFLSRV